MEDIPTCLYSGKSFIEGRTEGLEEGSTGSLEPQNMTVGPFLGLSLSL